MKSLYRLISLLTPVFYLALSGQFELAASERFHDAIGTHYGKEGANAYASSRHGPDGAFLLDPYFTPYLEDLAGKVVLDAGCGCAPWSIYSAEHGGKIFGIDLQEKMIELGLKTIAQAGLSDKIDLTVGDVACLPYSPVSFDLCLSINVGCNLPSTTLVNGQSAGLGPHLKEMRRVLKQGGLVIVTAPTSFGTLFTNGSDSETVLEHISGILNQLPLNPDPATIISRLNELTEVYRATFALANGELVLVTDERQLQAGQEIWRKLPGLTVPNRYHPESEYLREFEEAGFKVKNSFHPQFSNVEELLIHNDSLPDTMRLGRAYAEHPPFIIFCLE